MNIVMSFCPGQLGAYSATMHLVVGDGLSVTPLRAYGRCSDIAAKKPTTTTESSASLGLESASSLFKPTLKFVPQPGVPLKTEADIDAVTSMLDTAGFKDSVVIDPAEGKELASSKGW